MKKLLLTLCAAAATSAALAQEPVVVEPASQRQTTTTTTTTYYTPSTSYNSYDDRANHWAVGLNFNTGTASPVWAFGMGANLQFFATDDFRIEAAYNGYLRRNHWASWDIDLNLHYLIEVAEQLELYPILGGTFAHAQFKTNELLVDSRGKQADGKQKEGAFGINIGAGLQYSFNEHLFAKAEGYWKYVPSRKLEEVYQGYDGKLGPRVVAAVGIGYRF